MSDGSVYLEAEGPEKNITEFVRWCREGPDFAYIDHINVTNGSLKNYESFEVRF